MGAYGIEPAVIEHIVVYFLNWRHKEDAEDIGLHVIPNVCLKYSEQLIHSIGGAYRD